MVGTLYELYGIDGAHFSGAYDAWQAGLHPDDRERGDVAINEAINGARLSWRGPTMSQIGGRRLGLPEPERQK